MADTINAFRQALRNVCGMTAAAANLLTAQGFERASDLIPLSESDIDTFVKHTLKSQVVAGGAAQVTIPYNAVIKLKAFRYFAVLSERIGMEPLSQAFDAAMLEFVQGVMKERRERKNATEEAPEKPPMLKDLAYWRIFWEKFDAYLSQTIGAAEIGLDYVYRPHQDVTDEMRQADYDTNDARYYEITALEGAHYREDNKRVYAEQSVVRVGSSSRTLNVPRTAVQP